MKCAIILNGLVRIPSLTATDKLIARANHANANVFLVTNASQAPKIDYLKSKISHLHVYFVEDDIVACEAEERYKLEGMQPMLQWSKYSLALRKLRDHEINTNTYFDMIYRMRTDADYVSTDDLASIKFFNHLGSGFSLYANTDVSFGGRRESMMILEKLEEFFWNIYMRSNVSSLPINISQLSCSSGNSFKWMSFPVLVRSGNETLHEWCRKITFILSNYNSIFKRTGLHSAIDYLKNVAIEQHEVLTAEDYLHLNDKRVLFLPLVRKSGNKLSYILSICDKDIEACSAIRMFKGHDISPSEAIFARFVNLYGIAIHHAGPLQGDLIINRKNHGKTYT
jgi:hypothetical protein